MIIHGFNSTNIKYIKKRLPQTKIALLNPGNIIYYKWYKRSSRFLKKFLEENIDLIIVRTLVWKHLVESILDIHVYQFLDVENNFIEKPKTLNNEGPYIIGYHGNENHFANDFLVDGRYALQKLNKEFEIEIHIITSNASQQPLIEGVSVKRIEFSIDTFWEDVDKFTIGLCPIVNSETKKGDITTMIRNGNRAVSMMARGIPTVVSPTKQVLIDLQNNEHVLYANSSEEWFLALKKLLTEKDEYERISKIGLEHVKSKFNPTVGTRRLIDIFLDDKKRRDNE